jgi:hypothetical protein
LADTRKKLKRWQRDYNQNRPHTALDDRTPAQLAQQLGGAGHKAETVYFGHRYPMIRAELTYPSTRVLSSVASQGADDGMLNWVFVD